MLQVRYGDKDHESSSCSSADETLIWDSPPPPSPSDLPESPPKSVFDDWDDDPTPSPIIPTIIIEEEDGGQMVIIDSQSPFFSPPTPPSSPESGVPRLSINLSPNPMARRDMTADEVPACAVSPSSSNMQSRRRRRELEQPMKDQMLFVITASIQGGFALSSSPFYSLQPVEKAEVTSWAPKGLMEGPDVPLDCVYRGREISPAGQYWDERPWPLLHTVPCSSAF